MIDPIRKTKRVTTKTKFIYLKVPNETIECTALSVFHFRVMFFEKHFCDLTIFQKTLSWY